MLQDGSPTERRSAGRKSFHRPLDSDWQSEVSRYWPKLEYSTRIADTHTVSVSSSDGFNALTSHPQTARGAVGENSGAQTGSADPQGTTQNKGPALNSQALRHARRHAASSDGDDDRDLPVSKRAGESTTASVEASGWASAGNTGTRRAAHEHSRALSAGESECMSASSDSDGLERSLGLGEAEAVGAIEHRNTGHVRWAAYRCAACSRAPACHSCIPGAL